MPRFQTSVNSTANNSLVGSILNGNLTQQVTTVTPTIQPVGAPNNVVTPNVPTITPTVNTGTPAIQQTGGVNVPTVLQPTANNGTTSTTADPEPTKETPVYNKPWFWGVIAAVVGIGAFVYFKMKK